MTTRWKFNTQLESGVGLVEQFQRFRRMARDKRGVAAVEFALILPFMLLLYLGTAELTYGLMANRKMTLSARVISDLVSQTTATTGVTNADLDTVFTAARSVISPFDLTKLKMSVSSIEFVADTATPPVYTARVKWSAAYVSGSTTMGVPRVCTTGSNTITKVSNSTTPSSTTMPEGLYGAGTVIVADVSYNYTPPFSSSFFQWTTSSSSINFAQTTYMRPRTQTEIAYNLTGTAPAGRTKCTYP